jgi:large subunit ribosomal protein L3
MKNRERGLINMKKILATKQQMTQVFEENGNVVPVTLLNVKAGSDISLFQEGDKVIVSGISKGKGFQGVVKRHGFHGGPRTHGQKHSEREPGSIGATAPQRVFKGTRMAGRMGGDKITVKNLRIIKIDKEKNQLFLSGAVPGRKGTLLEIRSANFQNV